MMYLSQIIIPYTLNLCSALCQLYLKTGRKKIKMNEMLFMSLGNDSHRLSLFQESELSEISVI